MMPTSWRDTLHKFIHVGGLMALTAVIAQLAA
jgi:hypothetical protein